jgi:hypothetical protein
VTNVLAYFANVGLETFTPRTESESRHACSGTSHWRFGKNKLGCFTSQLLLSQLYNYAYGKVLLQVEHPTRTN